MRLKTVQALIRTFAGYSSRSLSDNYLWIILTEGPRFDVNADVAFGQSMPVSKSTTANVGSHQAASIATWYDNLDPVMQATFVARVLV